MIYKLLKRFIPNSVKDNIKLAYYKIITVNKPKIFCISVQRTGTTSVGDFFKHYNFRVATYKISENNTWSIKWLNGDFDSIFKSSDFKSHQVFEDSPWFLPEFYKVLYHKFPKAKFILFIRNSDDWFNSMKKYSNGKSLGNTFIHSKVYRREKEFYDRFFVNGEFNQNKANNLLSLEGMDYHYKTLYEQYNFEVISFFNSHNPKSLFVQDLDDENKWKNLGSFFNIDVPENLRFHSNKSKS